MKEVRTITDLTDDEALDLEESAKHYIMRKVRKELTLTERGCWVGSLGLYQGQKAQDILNRIISKVEGALYP